MEGIEFYKQESGEYLIEGTNYEFLEEAIVGLYNLGFCVCGCPDEALRHLVECLNLVNNLKELVWSKQIEREDWQKQVREVLPTGGAEYFMWYYLDDKGLTEHGGGVPGWLTDKGKQLLEDYKLFDNGKERIV